jgi:hypothetical protein
VPQICNEISRKTEAVEGQLAVGHRHGKFVVEAEFEVRPLNT